MYLIVMIFLRHLLESTTGRLQLVLQRSSSKRRENASFLGFREIVVPAAQAIAALPLPRKLPSNQPFS
jgi:hypothetical protein